MGLAPAGSLTPTSRRKKPRKRIHVVYSLVSSPLPHQLPDSHKRSFLGHKTRSEGGGEEGLTLRARYHLCQSAGCRHTAPPPTRGTARKRRQACGGSASRYRAGSPGLPK